jgi:hypothetical protein
MATPETLQTTSSATGAATRRSAPCGCSASLREIQILQARALRWVIDFMPTSHNCACALTVKWKAEALERGDITVPNVNSTNPVGIIDHDKNLEP